MRTDLVEDQDDVAGQQPILADAAPVRSHNAADARAELRERGREGLRVSEGQACRSHLPRRDIQDEADDGRAREVSRPDRPRAARAADVDQTQAEALDLDVVRLDTDLRNQTGPTAEAHRLEPTAQQVVVRDDVVRLADAVELAEVAAA